MGKKCLKDKKWDKMRKMGKTMAIMGQNEI